MATAAPAAPSTSAPEGAAVPGGPEATTPAPADNQPKLVKSAKPIPDLPGVFPDEDPFPAPPSSAKSATATGTATRGPDGRFLAAGTSPAGADSGEPTLEAADPATPTPPAGKYKFAGEEFASQSEAEQNFRSLRGQFRPVQSLARSLGGVDKIVPQFASAAESARGWHAEAQRLEAELATLRGQPAISQSDPAASPVEGIDWGLYAEIEKLATESGEPWKARQWLAEQQDALVDQRVKRVLDERLAPLADAEAKQALENQTGELFEALASYTNADGSVAYPELDDPQASYEIGKFWVALGLPAEYAMKPQGAIAAVAMYRMARGNRSQAGPRAVAAPVQPARSPAPPTDAQAAADLGDGRSRQLSVADTGSPSAEAARILQGLRQTNSGNRALLGFDA